MGFESPLKNAIPNPRSGRKDPEEGSHLRVSSSTNDTDNSESNYQEKCKGIRQTQRAAQSTEIYEGPGPGGKKGDDAACG